MAFTFGAGVGDDINTSINAVQIGASGANHFFCGWFYPTTLTAGRAYWTFGNTHGAYVGATTSELLLQTDNTTDGQWSTSGAGLVVDKWQFIAWANACENVSVDGAWRVWIGDINTAPVEITVNLDVARVGNYTSSGACIIGNAGTGGSLSFEGDIGSFTSIGVANAGINTFSTILTSGVISNDQADILYRRWVLPAWLGSPSLGFLSAATILNSLCALHIDLNSRLPVGWQYTAVAVASAPTALTINGATFSENRPPRIILPDWTIQLPRVRRGA